MTATSVTRVWTPLPIREVLVTKRSLAAPDINRALNFGVLLQDHARVTHLTGDFQSLCQETSSFLPLLPPPHFSEERLGGGDSPIFHLKQLLCSEPITALLTGMSVARALSIASGQMIDYDPNTYTFPAGTIRLMRDYEIGGTQLGNDLISAPEIRTFLAGRFLENFIQVLQPLVFDQARRYAKLPEDEFLDQMSQRLIPNDTRPCSCLGFEYNPFDPKNVKDRLQLLLGIGQAFRKLAGCTF